MIIIDAFWELRNLGLTTQEIEIEDTDSIDEIGEAIGDLKASYQVVKVSSARADVYKLLSDIGFCFMESLIRVSHVLKDLNCSGPIMRISDRIFCDEMCQEETELMEEQIRNGMFQTDRVTLDPFFTVAQAANRYIMWMRDEKDRGSKLLNYKYKEQPIGFSCFKEERPGIFYPVLGGVYNAGKALPLGTAIVFKQLEIAKEMGGKELFTYISSNNQAVVRTYSQLGYIFEEMKYVFVRHV